MPGGPGGGSARVSSGGVAQGAWAGANGRTRLTEERVGVAAELEHQVASDDCNPPEYVSNRVEGGDKPRPGPAGAQHRARCEASPAKHGRLAAWPSRHQTKPARLQVNDILTQTTCHTPIVTSSCSSFTHVFTPESERCMPTEQAGQLCGPVMGGGARHNRLGDVSSARLIATIPALEHDTAAEVSSVGSILEQGIGTY